MKVSLKSLATIAACALSSAHALEVPQIKPGLWEVSVHHTHTVDGKESKNVAKSCLDAAAHAHAKQVEDEYKKSCSKYEVRKDGGKWITDMVCKTGAVTMTSHGESSISDNAYHTELTYFNSTPTKGQARTVTIMDGKFLGPC